MISLLACTARFSPMICHVTEDDCHFRQDLSSRFKLNFALQLQRFSFTIAGNGDTPIPACRLVPTNITNIPHLRRLLHNRPSKAAQTARARRGEHTLQSTPWLTTLNPNLSKLKARLRSIDVHKHQVLSRATSAASCCRLIGLSTPFTPNATRKLAGSYQLHRHPPNQCPT